MPHDHSQAAQRYTNGLLWNHALSTATYTMYDNTWSPTITGAQDAQPTGHSKLCLGCHDGTVGIDTFDKYAGGGIFIDDFNPLFKMPGFHHTARSTCAAPTRSPSPSRRPMRQ